MRNGSDASDLKEDGADSNGPTRPDRPRHPRPAQTDGRSTGAEVGRRVGLSQPAASARIQRLEKNAVITSHRAVVDPAALGLNIHAVISSVRDHGEASAPASSEKRTCHGPP
ncbi:Lrp/AsnC family transcriptional regulator [Streptomyces sp. MUM 203J]|uniref:Lrp/AsnC family transcriptional regulator n=1 Tax=Streptomyces sp. MUM 203J TaxID=2791990 RepID=UPI001F04A296|nr:AsnC family transcriptional regulator [Streptomyces sp. MUM 203J]